MTWLRACVGLLGLCVVAVLAAGQAGGGQKKEEGYTSLFNGKDFTGWTYKGSKESLEGKTATPDDRMTVDAGTIVVHAKGTKGKGGIKDLNTLKVFDKDFILKLEFRAAERADSGVYVRGPQLQVRDYPRVGPYKNLKKFKDKDWNELEIVVTGTSAECKCNGEFLTKMKIPAKGPIGLQAESGKFEFRNIRVKEMP
jgi:hypothetical protein